MTEEKVYISDLSYPKEDKKCLIYRVFGFFYINIYISDDMSPLERDINKGLRQFLGKAKKLGLRASIRRNKLLVNGNKYTLEDLLSNPDIISPELSLDNVDVTRDLGQRKVLTLPALSTGTKIIRGNPPRAAKALVHGQVPARLVLYLLSWSGFLVSFMMRNDINLTIVAMVAQPTRTITNSSIEYCYVIEEGNNNTAPLDYGGTLEWSGKTQSYILSSFYWAYIISQIVGGLATQKLGTKRVFGYAQLATAICSLSIPWASETHYGLVIGLRFVQGFASGLTWPAMYALVGHWIPVPERSRFMSSFQGFSIGIGITYPLCGYLIANLGWRSVFYTTGSIGVIWCLIWYLLAFDSPETHPRISLSEQQYIKENTSNTYANSRKQKVPWKAILTSMPAWSIGITTFGRIWVHYTFIISGPTYMKSILGFSIEKNGLLSGAPFICSYVASVFFCYLADKLVTLQYISLTNCRKLMTALSQVVPGVLVLLISYLGCNIEIVLVMWFIAVTLITASYAGAMANIVDIAPNFAGPVLAFAQTIHMSASFLSPLAAFHMIYEREHLMSAWRNVFYVTGFVAISTYVFYQIWGTGDVQKWNSNGEKVTNQSEQEKLMLQKTPKHEPTPIVIPNGSSLETVNA